MKNRTIYLTILYILILNVSYLAAKQLVFIESSYDFETIKELDGVVTHQFEFMNNSNKSIEIESVKAP